MVFLVLIGTGVGYLSPLPLLDTNGQGAVQDGPRGTACGSRGLHFQTSKWFRREYRMGREVARAVTGAHQMETTADVRYDL